ncbi:unnamed protein product [Durusdinium trenchii]
MVLVPGVQVEQLGKVKSGPEPDSRFMSRKEYVQLAEAEENDSFARAWARASLNCHRHIGSPSKS